MGGNASEGNTDEINASLDLEATMRTENVRFNIRFLYNYGEDDNRVTTRNWLGSLKYDYFLNSWYTYLAVEMYNDKFEDVDLRTAAGPGLGYQFWDEASKSLALEAGMTYLSENLKEGEDDQWINARFAGDLMIRIFESVTFREQPLVYVNVEDTDKVLIRNEASIRTAIGTAWALRLTSIIKHDTQPSEEKDVLKTDYDWIFALELSF